MKVSRGRRKAYAQIAAGIVGQVISMAARVTQCSAHVLRARQPMLPVPPAHRGAMLSSLIWSLSNPSASLPYLRPAPSSAPAFPKVIKRGITTVPDSKHLKTEDSDEEALARFHRAVRDESESFVDMWSLPLETLGALPSFESPHCPASFLVVRCDSRESPTGGFLCVFWESKH